MPQQTASTNAGQRIKTKTSTDMQFVLWITDTNTYILRIGDDRDDRKNDKDIFFS